MVGTPKVVTLTPMQYEVPKLDTRGRPGYVWRDGWLAKTADGRDVYPPCSWHEAVSITTENHKGTEVLIVRG